MGEEFRDWNGVAIRLGDHVRAIDPPLIGRVGGFGMASDAEGQQFPGVVVAVLTFFDGVHSVVRKCADVRVLMHADGTDPGPGILVPRPVPAGDGADGLVLGGDGASLRS